MNGLLLIYTLIIFFNIYKVMINGFDDFLLESYITESVLYFSPRFRNQLKFMSLKDDQIAKEILDMETLDIKQDITLVDLDPDNHGYLTFIPMKNALKKINHQYPNVNNSDIQNNIDTSVTDFLWSVRDQDIGAGVFTTGRNYIKLGKFVNKLFNNKFNNSQIEKFTNLFKSEKQSNSEKIKIVSGEEITHWYDSSEYYEQRGTLGSSCMKNSPSHYFKIYKQNPNSVRLVILTLDDKLLGRALVWKLNSISHNIGAKYYMDRVYVIDDYQSNKFVNFAKENGWAYRRYPIRSTFSGLTYNGVDYIRDDIKMTVKIEPINYGNYPYMDTFQRYDEGRGILYNDNIKKLGGHILTSTQGSHQESIPRARALINRFTDFLNI
jgi:hypothetical protein